MKHGESKTATDLPANVKYTVKEDDYSNDGYKTSSTGETGTISKKDISAAVFTNTKDEFGSLTVSKTVAGNSGDKEKEFRFTVTLSDNTINGTFGNMEFEDGVASFTLKHGESKTATDLPANVKYTVAEDDYSKEGYKTSSTGETGTISKKDISAAVFTNTKDEFGSLTVSKTVAGNSGDKEKEFRFTVTLSDNTINGTFGNMEFKDGVASFTLKHGESKTATGLPAGIGYTAEETEANQDGYETTSTADKGTVPENGNVDISFTNTKSITGNLTVTKEVVGTHGDKDREFHFTVTLDNKTISGKFGDMDFTDGVATFTLKHGQSATATGLPAGIGYTAEETEANQDGYETTSTADKGTVPENGNVEIKFINHKEVTSEKPSTPDKTDTLDSPKTGDRANIELYISLCAMSGLLIAILTVLKKKKILENR